MIPLSDPIRSLIAHLSGNGVKPIFVGGFVRDHLNGRSTNDIDIELYDVPSLEMLETLLSPFGSLNAVGKSFGVLKLSYAGYTIDFAPPRSDSKHSSGHRGFEITTLQNVDFATAARRRDFTINAIGYDPMTHTFLDPFGGIEDLRNRTLRCVDPNTFIDDPLRVLRAVQFVARFDLECDPLLLDLCRTMISQGALDELPKERIFEEFKKLFLKSQRPSLGLKLLEAMGALPLFPPLDRLGSTLQDPLSHPEGDVWTHILMCVDAMAERKCGDEREDLILMYAALLHDIAKPHTTVIEAGKVNAPGHGEAGVDIARKWMERITTEKALIDAILPLIRYHGYPRKLWRHHASDPELLRLSTKVPIGRLIMVAEADFFGREFVGSVPERFEAGDWLYLQAKRLGILIFPPAPLLQGRNLIDLGLQPSERFKTLLEQAYDAQLNLRFTTHESAIAWAKEHLVTQL